MKEIQTEYTQHLKKYIFLMETDGNKKINTTKISLFKEILESFKSIYPDYLAFKIDR